MLDDLKTIHLRDKSDALGVASRQWQLLNSEFDVPEVHQQQIRNVVVAGMGGSALPAVFLTSWPTLSVPLEIVRNYTLPRYVDKHTLVIVSSYSGNTEETMSVLAEAEQLSAQIAVVTAGGKLASAAKEKSLPIYVLPTGAQPRMMSFSFISAFVQLLETYKLVREESTRIMQSDAGWLGEQLKQFGPEVPTKQNMAKRIALDLVGKTVIIYSGPLMYPAANKWKICINENAKNLAWANQYPEFNHNEFVGWTSHPVDKPFAVVEIRSRHEHPRLQKRFEVAERLLSGRRPAPLVVEPVGDSALQQLLWAATLGDFVSIYLALLNNVDPTPVDLVEKFKAALDE